MVLIYLTDCSRGDRQGGRNEFLILCGGSAGSGLPLPRLRPFLGVEFRPDFRVRNGKYSTCKICELAKVTCRILRGTLRVIRQNLLLESESRRRASEKSISAALRRPRSTARLTPNFGSKGLMEPGAAESAVSPPRA